MEIPADDVLVAASIELRQLGEGKHPAAGRYGTCIGVYGPPQAYSLIDIDPFTDERGPVTPVGVISERCTFWYENDRVIADTMFTHDPPQMHYYCKRISAPAPTLIGQGQEPITEGSPELVVQTVYERDPALRAMCIRIHGCDCMICNTSFENTYGDSAVGFIHVHHLEPLGAIGKTHAVDPATDLIPVCPNCHAVIHLRTPPFTPDEVKAMLRRTR